LKKEYDDLSNDGFRVLAVATKELTGKQICAKVDERELVLRGTSRFSTRPRTPQPARLRRCTSMAWP